MCGESKCCTACKNKTVFQAGSFEESPSSPSPIQDQDQVDADADDDEAILVGVRDFSDTNYQLKEDDGMADWIQVQDRIPLKLAISLYSTPINQFGGYKLFAVQPRSGAWYNCTTQTVIIGLRGTSILNSGGLNDLLDDTVS